MRPEPILQADAITAGYGGAPVIMEVSAQVGRGEVVAIVGPNGSGKSTLLKSMIGQVQVMSGRVLLGQQDITNWTTADVARARVGYVPQTEDVFGPLTVRENLDVGGYLLPPRQIPGRIDHVVSVFPALGRMLNRRAAKLSGGERKMLAISRVLMLQPELFLLDEPTANLAPAIARILLEEHIANLAATGTSILLVEQRARSALAISDWTYVMTGGQCQLSGTSAGLSEREDFAEAFLGGAADQV
jgi:branched-chain amino acid transport system ATP-binding protein